MPATMSVFIREVLIVHTVSDLRQLEYLYETCKGFEVIHKSLIALIFHH